jgi:FMN phosphatase YigB (HAD superfamily)
MKKIATVFIRRSAYLSNLHQLLRRHGGARENLRTVFQVLRYHGVIALAKKLREVLDYLRFVSSPLLHQERGAVYTNLPECDTYTQTRLLNRPTKRRLSELAKVVQVSPVVFSREELLSQYKWNAHSAEAYSFDVFDTLVERVVPRPVDVFFCLSSDFKELFPEGSRFVQLRAEAEQKARLHSTYEEVTLAEIYEQFGLLASLDTDVCRIIQDAEIHLEKKLLRPRPQGFECYQRALQSGRPIGIISDIYWSKEDVEDILHRVGYCGWTELFVSSQRRKTKHSGALYTDLINSLEVQSNRILHLGDNPHSDGAMAKREGLSTILIGKSVEQWSEIAPDAWKETQTLPLAERMMVGLIIHARERAKADERSEHNAPWFGNPRLLGFSTLGPVLLGFVLWLRKQLQLHPEIESCAFLSRDGYFLKQAFDFLKRLDSFARVQIPRLGLIFFVWHRQIIIQCQRPICFAPDSATIKAICSRLGKMFLRSLD